jgi:hypothetical protein
MALQFSTALRDALIGQIETTVGTAPRLQIRTGAPPATPADADAGTLLVEITLPTDWLSAESSGQVSKLGTWQGTATASGTAGHFRLKNSAGTTTHMQGTVTATGGGGDMTLDNTNISSGQTVTINTFTLTQGNS